ncbi:hypothetical protein FACS189464_0010 [Bacteroidia bacterium]|nr:hypothetical protein FACS189464_0010 [Bacteroidia bacterium]
MIKVFEHFEFGETKGILQDTSQLALDRKYCKTIKRKGEDALCYSIQYDENGQNHYCQTSYFVGVDWVIENILPIYVQPKQNKTETEINYLKMLFEALKEPQNFDHLEDLCEIDFQKPAITIEHQQDLLSPFLIIQFLQILKKIVQKGLKKSYYSVTHNLESRVKGKILVNQTVKNDILKNKLTKTVCRYDEFGFDCDENKILKKAFLFSQRMLADFHIENEGTPIQQIVNYISPAFAIISDDIQIDKVKGFKPNPLYKEYAQALKLAILILKRFSYNISNTSHQTVNTPPFWIDMSKLFELYVFKKLKERFPMNREVQYHVKAHYRELDFLIKSKDKKYIMVVDTKYKPRYQNHNISIDDMRQVCGYARLEKVYDELNLNDDERNKIIDCLIVYSHQKPEKDLLNDDLKSDDTKEKGYVNFYKIGIALPEISSTS